MLSLTFLALFALGAQSATTTTSACSVLNRDNCFRAVFAQSATGTADCSSFFAKTNTPCPVTTTLTQTSTPVVLSTATTSTTVFVTVASTVSATASFTTTVTSVETDSFTVTTTATITTTTQLNKRATAVPELPSPVANFDKRAENDVALAARAVTSCPAVSSPTATPTYASACSGTVRYSSACACLGVSMSTSTLTPVTSSTTITVTASPTTSVVSTVTQTSTQTVTTPTTVTSASTTVTVTVQTTTSTTSTAQATATTAAMGYQYVQAFENTATTNCFYDENRVTNYEAVSDDSSNNYLTGRQQCADFCTALGSSQCQSFAVFRSTDPSGTYHTYCFATPAPYDSSYYVCGQYDTTTLYAAFYNKQ